MIRVLLESNSTKISKKKSTTKQKKIRLGAKIKRIFDIKRRKVRPIWKLLAARKEIWRHILKISANNWLTNLRTNVQKEFEKGKFERFFSWTNETSKIFEAELKLKKLRSQTEIKTENIWSQTESETKKVCYFSLRQLKPSVRHEFLKFLKLQTEIEIEKSLKPNWNEIKNSLKPN